jgi:hypothetical protein
MQMNFFNFVSELLYNLKFTVRQVAKAGENEIIGNIGKSEPPAFTSLAYSI